MRNDIFAELLSDFLHFYEKINLSLAFRHHKYVKSDLNLDIFCSFFLFEMLHRWSLMG